MGEINQRNDDLFVDKGILASRSRSFDIADNESADIKLARLGKAVDAVFAHSVELGGTTSERRLHSVGHAGHIIAIMDKWHLENGGGGSGVLAQLPGKLPSDSGQVRLQLQEVA
jgi:hypothetical protein